MSTRARLHFRHVLAYALLIWAAGVLATGVQAIFAPRPPDIGPGAATMLLLAFGLGAVSVLPTFLGVGVLLRGAAVLAERAGMSATPLRLCVGVVAGMCAYGLLAGGLWWVLSGFAWPTTVAASALGAGWLLPTRPTRA